MRTRRPTTKPKRVFVSADPFVDVKTGVAYASEYLLRRLIEQCPPGTQFDLGYFDFRGTRGSPDPTLGRPRRQRRFPSAIYLKLMAFGLAPLLELLWRRRYDVVLCNNNYLMPSTAPMKVVIIHDLGYLVCPEHLQPGRSGVAGRIFPSGPRFLTHVIPRAARRSDLILTWSHAVKAEMATHLGVPPDKVLVIPFLPDDRHRPNPTAVPPERFELDRPFVLCQATIEPRKNHRVLIEAFALLEPEVRSLTSLVLAGGAGWSSDALLARIAELQGAGVDIRVTGYVSEDERLALYQSCAVAVQPSHYEGFGMPVLEAMACSAPIVCSDIPVLREVGGKVAEYFEKDDPADLAARLRPRLEAALQGSTDRLDAGVVRAHFSQLEAQGDTGTMATRMGLV